VWYDNDMKTGQPYKVCQEDESNDCSNGLVPIYRLNDHLTYFGVHVSSYGEAGCKMPVS
ncbi:Lipase, partial [Aphelenchoides avenae]